MNDVFASKDYTAGQLNAMVKKLIEQGGADALDKFLRGELVLKMPDLLKLVASKVQVSGAKRFVAKDELESANVGYTGSSNFDNFFLNKVEENVGEATLAVHKLEKNSVDAPIMTELGSRAEISLAHFFDLLKKQSKGQKGTLLVNRRANIAYIRGTDGNIWAVNASWNSYLGCWFVFADSVEGPDGWGAGRQVLSRDS